MKVIISVFNNLYTDQRVEKVCKTLTDNGYKVELIGNNWGGLPTVERSYPVTRIILKSKILRYAYVEFQWKLYQAVKSRIDTHTILLANDLDTILPNYLISRRLNVPLVFDSHEIFTEMPSLQGRFTQKIWRALEQFTVPKLQYMMTASESYADWFAETYGIIRPVAVQNFPRLQNFSPEHEGEKSPKIILYQGYINPSRGLDKVIPAMASIRNAELWIAGDGPRKEEYVLLTKNLGLESRVRFLGKLLPTELRKITRRADVGLSIEENNGLSYYYSMPNKISDYIQARVPVVVSDFPEMGKIIDRFGVGEKIAEHSELAEKISIVLRNGKAYYRTALEKAAAELCWENEEPKLLRLFGRVVSDNF